MIIPFRGRPSRPRIATSSSQRGRKSSGASFATVLDHPDLADDARFADNASRVKNRTVLVPLLEQIFRSRTAADWLERLRAADVPAAPVNNVDAAFAEPPVKEREMIVEYDHPQVGKVRLPGNPIKMSGM